MHRLKGDQKSSIVFRLALRQTEGLIASIVVLLGLDPAVPDHSTLNRRTEMLEVPKRQPGNRPIYPIVDSTGLQLCGPGGWLVEKHGSRTRRSWRKPHIGVDADTGRIVAFSLTTSDVDDASQVGPLLDQVADLNASFTADGTYDQDSVPGLNWSSQRQLELIAAGRRGLLLVSSISASCAACH
jgi:IS5 family transposase